MKNRVYRRISSQNGFTLIEMIVTLVLVGIIAAFAGMGLVKISEGYLLAKLNAETSQKAQIAIARISKELSSATDISSAVSDSVTYTRPVSQDDLTNTTTNTIALTGSTITVNVDSAGAAVLMDRVTDFSMSFMDASGTVTGTPEKIRRIEFELEVTGANNTTLNFDNNTLFLYEF